MKGIKNKFYVITIIILVLLLIGAGVRSAINENRLRDELQASNELVIEKDKTIMEKEGQYAKLVDYFEDSKSLMSGLKDSNKELAKQINKANEKLLQVSDIVATFKEKQDEGDLDQINDSTFNMSLFYPNTEDWFINWDGSIYPQTNTYKGIWKFGKLELQAVLTETERGLWNARLIGPDFLIVDSIQVKSLPPEDYDPNKNKNLEFLIGGGYRNSYDKSRPNAITVGGGIQWKNRSVIMIEAGSNSTVGLNYYYKFQTLKRK